MSEGPWAALEPEQWEAYWGARYSEAAAGLLADLRVAGFEVDTVQQLRMLGTGFEDAVPVLTAWLPKVTYLPLKKDIIAALWGPHARAAAGVLLEEYRRASYGLDPDPAQHPDAQIRWDIGWALGAMADEQLAPEVAALVADCSYGAARAGLVEGLSRIKGKPALLALIARQLDDDSPQVVVVALKALKRTRAIQFEDAVKKVLDHPEPWVRKEARAWLRWAEKRT